MGNNASSKFGCISAPMNDGEQSYVSVKTRSKSSKNNNNNNNQEFSYSESYTTSLSPPAPSMSHSYSHSSSLSHSYSSNSSNHNRSDSCCKQNIKILFLDVDGVLNSRLSTNVLDDKLLKYLKLILLKTQCKIVLSTTWRLNIKAKQILLHTIKTRLDINIDDIIIGQTKNFKYLGNGNFNRSHEIFDYIKTNQHKYNIISWCAIDDISLNKFNDNGFSKSFMKYHFVKTNPTYGITPTNIVNCIDILNQTNHKYNNLKPYYY